MHKKTKIWMPPSTMWVLLKQAFKTTLNLYCSIIVYSYSHSFCMLHQSFTMTKIIPLQEIFYVKCVDMYSHAKTTIYVLSINTNFFKDIFNIFLNIYSNYTFSHLKNMIRNIWINKMHRVCFVESTLVFIRCSQMQILIDSYFVKKLANSFHTLLKFSAFIQKYFYHCCVTAPLLGEM